MASIRDFLFRHSGKLFILHTLLVGVFCLVPSFMIHYMDLNASWRFLHLFTLIGFCQNIGLIHEFAHRPLHLMIARFYHALGGLRYSYAKLLHIDHHRYLGTSQDPDRNGYTEHTLTRSDRFLYLIFIGPLRNLWAPVDLTAALVRLPHAARIQLHREKIIDLLLLISIHLGLLLTLKTEYLWLFASLLVANILSNLREMTEHGRGSKGSAAYVNVRPSVVGVLFLSTPGFWFHGTHHQHPHIPYWMLPSEANRQMAPHVLHELPFLERSSYWRYLWGGL